MTVKNEFIKEHILGIFIVISAIIQFIFLLYVNFATGSSNTKQFIPMTITPYEEIVQVVKKVVKETSEEEADEEKDEDLSRNQSVAQQNNTPNFLSFIRVDQIAKARTSLKPPYPDMARNAGVEGMVIIEAYIDENGKVRNIKIKKGIGFGCEEAAARMLRSINFIPAKMNGKPVAVRQIFRFEFRLE